MVLASFWRCRFSVILLSRYISYVMSRVKLTLKTYSCVLRRPYEDGSMPGCHHALKSVGGGLGFRTYIHIKGCKMERE